MEFETLKRGNKWYVIGGVVIIVGIIIASVITTSRAKYRTTQSIPLVRGKINYKVPDFKMMAMYINDGDGDVEVDVMPSSGYVINEERSYCTLTSSSEKDSNARLYTNSKGEHIIANIQKNGKCYLYFDKYVPGNTMSEILAGYTQTTMPSITGIDETVTTKQVYSVTDDYGTSYVFRGAPIDNWVSFGGYYWRIIRMNGDGSTRLIYVGESVETTGADDEIGTSAYNSSYNDNAYVGYMYGSTGASTYAATHANTNNSTIKGSLDTWYGTYLNKTGVKEYIDGNAGFCSDRQSSSSASGTYGTTYGYGTNQTYYIAYDKLNAKKAPSLKCTNKSTDLFTTSGSSQGNGKLTYPVGLITADEVAYAGGVYGTNNSSYYLYTGQTYWTMSPSYFNGVYAGVFYVYSIGSLNNYNVRDAYGVRPVINLKADTQFTGSGLANDPFLVAG